jgi:hypothetical protein
MFHHLFITTLIISIVGNWCDCEPYGKINNEQYNSYDVIFKGRVIGIKEGRFEKTINLKVETFYKGKQNSNTIKIVTPVSQGECGIFPKPKENWLVFACFSGTKVETTLCTRTKTMNPSALDYDKDRLEDDLKFLEAKRDSSLSHIAQ